MKIALIGNMNNNLFSMMRYFRDLGIDATLFLFKNEQSHFLPEYDSWEINKWKKYIIKTNLTNGFKKTDFSLLYTSKSEIKKIFESYNIIIGCGISPVYINRAGLKLDLFVPYGMNVEYTDIHSSSISKIISSTILKCLQEKAISNSVSYSVSFDKITIKKLNKYGPKVLHMGLPMLYNKENSKYIPKHLNEIIKKFAKHDLIIFSHISHIWKNIPITWRNSYSRNDLLISAFSNYLKKSTLKKPLLVLFDYGPDVLHTKQLIKKYNIQDNILWLNIMPRKDIMILLKYVDIGVGKLGDNYMWGGVGWEFLASGVPFFYNLQFSNEEYSKLTSIPMPNIFKNASELDIINHLLNFEKSPNNYKKIGKELQIWFNKYGGVGLASIWKDIVTKIYMEKQTYANS